MRRLQRVALYLFLTSGLAMAQEAPAVEVFGGYSHTAADFTGVGQKHTSFNGWNASLAGSLNRWLGVVADFSGQYGSSELQIPLPSGIVCPPPCLPPVSLDTKAHEFLFGPQFSLRRDRVTPFAHTLFGVSHFTSGISISLPVPLPGIRFSTSQTSLAMALGGGVDYRLTNRFAWRAQADYLMTHLFHDAQNNFRFSTGVVVRF